MDTLNRTLFLLAVTVAGAAGIAQASAQDGGFVVHTNAQIAADEQHMLKEAGNSPGGVSLLTLHAAGQHSLLLVVRAKTGDAELHEQWGDEIVVRHGRMMLVVGGTLKSPHPDAKNTPGEQRAPGIEGGAQVELGPGDTAQVPPNTPHRVKTIGEPVTYLVYKVK